MGGGVDARMGKINRHNNFLTAHPRITHTHTLQQASHQREGEGESPCLVIIPCLRYTKQQLGSELRLLLLICVVRVVGIREKCRKNYEEIFNEKIFADFVNDPNEWKRRRDIQKIVFSVCFSGSLKFVILSLNSMEPCGVCVVCVPFIFFHLVDIVSDL